MLGRSILGCLVLAAPFVASACSSWQMVVSEEFDSPEAVERWKLDGLADLSVRCEDGASFLRIETRRDPADKTKRQSTLWFAEPVWGESVRYVFRVRGDERNRSLFFFSARPTEKAGVPGIFDWERPDGRYVHYAGSDRIELYSLGFLRYNEKECNVRYLGGENGSRAHNIRDRPTADGKPPFTGDFEDFFARASVFRAYPSPYAAAPPGAWFECDLRVEGRRVVLFVDGRCMFDAEDPGHGELAEYAWQRPLTGGGWFAFRNFMDNRVDVDYLRVYRKGAGGKNPIH